MGRSIVAGARAILGLGLLLGACGSSKTNTDNDPGSANPSGDGGERGGGDEGDAAGASASPRSCVPFTKRCDGQQIKGCNADGASESIDVSCVDGLRCVQAGSTAHCDTRACTPGQPLCDGNVATSCAPDGTGPIPGGKSCNSQKCELGKCIEVECEANAVICSNGDVYRCGKDGASIALVDDCDAGELCDPDAGKCLPPVCTPSARGCNGTIANSCNDFGTAILEPIDCADDGLQCYGGKCTKQICQPALRYCRDDDVVQCSLSGEELTLSQTCNHASEHCEESSGGFAFCFSDVCAPGKLSCDRNQVKLCTEQGDFPNEVEEDCGEGWCQDGACMERVCEVGSYFCQDSDIYYCQYQAPPDLYMECNGDTVCRSAGATSDPSIPYGVFCGEHSCAAGETACLKNQIGKCASDGESLSQVTTDCASDDKICTADLKCATSATDQLGVGETGQFLYSESFTGNLLEVSSARTLTQLKAYLLFPSARQLRWVIYEQSGTAFVAKTDKVASVASGTGLIASPAFSFRLQAGKRYLVGLAVSGGDVSSYYDGAPYAARISFGAVLGQFSSPYVARYDYLDSFTHDWLLQLEITTEP